MKTKLVLAGLAVLVILAAVHFSGGKDWSHHTGKVPFIVGYEKGLEKAKLLQKPRMLFFTTTWCGWCKKLAEESFTDEEAVRELDAFVPVLVDCDVEKDVAQRFGVHGFPTVRFVNAENEELAAMNGYAPAEHFLRVIAEAKGSAGLR